MGPTYCIDTNIVVFMQRRLPRDIYPGVWDQMEALIVSGRAIMPADAHRELGRVDDGCFEWATNRPGFVEEPDTAAFALVDQITGAHPDWVSERVNEADPWVIAHACVGGYVVVTDERRKGPGTADHNLKIPNVADEHDLHTMPFNEMARAEGWVFTA